MDEAAPAREKEYTGPGIVVTFNSRRCIHSANCVRGLPEVFDTKKRPWIQPDAADAERVAEVVMRCPTGALHFRRLDGGAEEPKPVEVTVTPQPDGPLYVRGWVRVLDEQGNVIHEDTRMAFCRCGHSNSKPFCDGSHERVGFRSAPDVPAEQA